MKHKHRYKICSWQYPPDAKYLTKENWPLFYLRCKCGEKYSRPMTNEEVREYRKKRKESEKQSKDLHKVWHKFVDKFGDGTGWKLSGYDFIYAVEQYGKRNPEIIVLYCDDALFATSAIVLIPHRNKINYMGTTMLIVPQLRGEITQVFLYPQHANALMKALKVLK